MSSYDPLSIFPKDELSLPPSAYIAIIVITRWNDVESRMFLRNTILGFTEKKLLAKIKLLFVFGIPQSASKFERVQIKNEQEKFHDMIIPSELLLLIHFFIYLLFLITYF